MSNPWYKEYSDFLASHFSRKMQKLTVNAAFPCPNRNGTLGLGGCTYCNNMSFSPSYCHTSASVSEQLRAGIEFFGRKYSDMCYLAYFQAYTSTNADVDTLMGMYREALSVDGVEGVVIGTRPDCMPRNLLDALTSLGKWVMVEFGAESSHDETLKAVNRCHTWECTVDAVRRTHDAGIPVGLHLIMGLPGETDNMMMKTVDAINSLPVDVVKFHQLQLLRGTPLSRQVLEGKIDVKPFTLDEYLELCCRIVGRLRSDIAIDRFVSQAPAELLISPRWGLKNYEFTNLLHNKLLKQNAK